ncbi:unnamed protein product [Protopolystoma xenopodis]|uniref:Uncharacterized protein n=1 Tax=Protopolystoma xenopodis TaxID=117903 RepID=A0A448XB44_9PLAT|nr:unnamed protein product [Protopolystoma xenopodis]
MGVHSLLRLQEMSCQLSKCENQMKNYLNELELEKQRTQDYASALTASHNEMRQCRDKERRQYELISSLKYQFAGCKQKCTGETVRTTSTDIKKHQRLSRKIDTERLEVAEHISLTGKIIDWRATERLASYGENITRQKLKKAVDILFQRNLINRRFSVAFGLSSFCSFRKS